MWPYMWPPRSGAIAQGRTRSRAGVRPWSSGSRAIISTSSVCRPRSWSLFSPSGSRAATGTAERRGVRNRLVLGSGPKTRLDGSRWPGGLDEALERGACSLRRVAELREQPVEREEARPPHFSHCRAIAAPPPLERVRAETAANGIQHDVARELDQVMVALHQHRMEPALEEMPVEPVPVVEPHCIEEIEAVHPDRQVLVRGLDQEVVVVWHEAIRVAAPAVAGDNLAENGQKQLAVSVISEDLLPAIAARGDVEDPAGQLQSVRPRHTGHRSAGCSDAPGSARESRRAAAPFVTSP